MKHLVLFLLLTIFSIPVFAQFPLGSNMKDIKAYFDKKVPYASAQVFKVEDGTRAICFTKVRVVGDYTFYFDINGTCTSYVVTYDEKDLPALTKVFDANYCKLNDTRWTTEDNSYEIKLIRPKNGENFISLVYKPLRGNSYASMAIASN